MPDPDCSPAFSAVLTDTVVGSTETGTLTERPLLMAGGDGLMVVTGTTAVGTNEVVHLQVKLARV